MNENWKCHKCGADGYKTDGQSNVWCEKCLGIAMHPQYIRMQPKVGRNELCTCGSGKKNKKCCNNS